jgi:glycerophosphoryl diester phosphodiesterase
MATLHPFVSASRVMVFAHRGGSALAPENTFAAFDNGLALGADGLELDVHLSRDGRPVVHHDPSLERTTNGSGTITACTAAELGQLDAGYRFPGGGDFPFRGRGFSVPTLRQVLERYPSTRIIIEMKSGSADLARATLEEVRRAGALGRVCFAGADVRGLRVIRALEPEAATSAGRDEIRWAVYRGWARFRLRRAPYVAFQVPLTAGPIRVVSPRFVRAAHRAGVRVQVWTIDTEEDMRRLIAWGVDGLITDRPDIGVRVIGSL